MNSLGPDPEGSPSASSSDRPDESNRVTRGTISTRGLIEPIFMRTFYFGVMGPFLFAYLGSSNVLAPLDGQAQWLVSRLAPVWPVLPAQYELVREVRGPGHAASYGFLCAALWVWPVIIAVLSLSEQAKRGKEILPTSPKEIGQFIFVIPFAVFFLVFDTTRIASPLFGFRADQWGLFYLRQWFLFSATAAVLGILPYALGRVVLERIRHPPD